MFGKVLIPFLLFFGWHFQAEPVVAIHEPQPGSAIQGAVTIVATTTLDDFTLAELSFQYSGSAPEEWFPLGTMDQPVQAEPVAIWDTTTMTDGDYRLRLRVYQSDGDYEDALLDGLRVRNYSSIETSTPTAAATSVRTALVPTEKVSPTGTSVLTISGTPTPLPANPASITFGDILSNALSGGLVVLGGFGIFGVYLRIRSWFRGG